MVMGCLITVVLECLSCSRTNCFDNIKKARSLSLFAELSLTLSPRVQ